MKRVPRRVKLYGQTVRICFKKNLKHPDGEVVYGYCDFDKNVIYLDSGMEKTMEIATYYHELVHMILFKLNHVTLSRNENFVDGLSGLIYQAEQSKEY